MDKKIRTIVKIGETRYLSVTDLIPEDWKLVQAKVIKANNKNVTIQVRKLLGEHDLASNTAANKANKQDASTSR